MTYTPDSNGQQLRPCGCWCASIPVGLPRYASTPFGLPERYYMPQINLAAHTTIMSITSKTVLKQTFVNSSTTQAIDQASYTFPLYDGVSVVGFECQVGTRIIRGLVKEKEQAREDYTEAISRGETAGLLEQLPESSDVFTTRIGNIPAGEKVFVEITYVGELKHDAEVDGVRFTIPAAIAPRYGTVSNSQAGLPSDSSHATDNGRIEITVDITVDEASFIRGIQSPSHPIGVTLGRTSAVAEDSTDPHRASATLSLGSAELEKDFVLLVLAKDQDIPRALLETHPKFSNQRALLATLVPRFNLPPIRPELVFIVDRSGSMQGKITTVVSALKVFLKSLPVGVKFNICSFGSRFSFLWPRSKSYYKSSLEEALAHVSTFAADFNGTQMFEPVVETVKKRYKDMQLEVMVLTDGQVFQQQALFDFINETAFKEPVRFFSLGVGVSVSHSLVEGIARAGNGFAQFVGEDEKLDKKVVRMLKGALTPHITDYTLEVKYEESIAEGYEMVEEVTEGLRALATDPDSKKEEMSQQPTISLFDPSRKDDDEKKTSLNQTEQVRYSHLPTIAPPKVLQAPSQIPPLYPFIRTSAYLLMSLEACQNAPKSVILRATSEHGPLELEIPVQDIGKGETIHQLAAKKAMTELEEGRGWIINAKGDDDKKIKDRFDGRWEEIVQREAVRLGVNFQVGGKWCSFVAVQKNTAGVEQEKADFMPRAHGSARRQLGFTFGSAAIGPPASPFASMQPLNSAASSAPFPSSWGFTFGSAAIAPPASPFASMQPFNSAASSASFGSSGDGTANFGACADAFQARAAGSAPFPSSGGLIYGAKKFGSAPSPLSGGFQYDAFQAQAAGSAWFGSSGGGTANFGACADAFQARAAGSAPFRSSFQYGTGSPPQFRSSFQYGTGNIGACADGFQAPAAASGPFGSSGGGTANFGACADAFQAQAAGSAPFWSSEGLQSQTGNSSFGASGSAFQAPAPLWWPMFEGLKARSIISSKHENDMDVDVKADGIDSDNGMSTTQADAGSAEELRWKSLRLETPADRMHALISLQGFDGSWGWSDELFHVVGLTKEAATSLHGDRATVATVLGVAFLERRVFGEKETWELVVAKAREWLEMRGIEDVEVEVKWVAAVWA